MTRGCVVAIAVVMVAVSLCSGACCAGGAEGAATSGTETSGANGAGMSGARDLTKIQSMLKETSRPLRWVITGDSITMAGYLKAGERRYSDVVEEHIRKGLGRGDDLVTNTAVGGYTCAMVLGEFDRMVLAPKPDVVSVMLGANDSFYGPEKREEFRRNMVTLVKRVREASAIPILNTSNMLIAEEILVFKDAENYMQVVREVAREQDVVLVDHWAWWKANRADVKQLKEWLRDACHPNERGQREIAEVLIRVLR